MTEKQIRITRHVCPRNCYDACGILAYTNHGKIEKIEGDPLHGFTKGKLCVKGIQYLNEIQHPNRLKYPMIQEERGSGNWRRISWDEAIERIAQKIVKLKGRYDSNLSLALYKHSGNLGVLHDAFVGMFHHMGPTTEAIGSTCHPSGLDAVLLHFGNHQTSDPEELTHAQVIFLWGVNPAWTSVHTLSLIYEAQSRGAKVVVIDPIYTTTAKKADLYIQIKPGADGALALALSKQIVENRLQDEDFIEQYTYGWDAYKRYLQSLSLDELIAATGQSKDVILRLANLIGERKPITIWMGLGLQRHANGGQNMRAIQSLGALTGNIGRSGAGVHFIHQSTWNFTHRITGPNVSNREVDFSHFATELGHLSDPPVKLLWIASNNPFTQAPNQEGFIKSLQHIEMIVMVDLFKTATSQYSDLLLPTTSIFEEMDVVPSYWHHWVGINEKAIEPYYESKSDLEIAQLLSHRLNQLSPGFTTFPTEQPVETFLDHEFNNELYQLLPIEHWQELRRGPVRALLSKIAWENKHFLTPTGKFEFYSSNAKAYSIPALPRWVKNDLDQTNPYPFYLLTPHSQHRINSQFQSLDEYLNLDREPILLMQYEKMKALKIKEGEMVELYNEQGKVIIKASASHDLSSYLLVIYHAHLLPSLNTMISHSSTDMGMISSKTRGIAFYDTRVNVRKIGMR